MTELSIEQVYTLRTIRTMTGFDAGPFLALSTDSMDSQRDAMTKHAARVISERSGHPVEPEELERQQLNDYSLKDEITIRHRWAPGRAGYVEAELHGGHHHGEAMVLPDHAATEIRLLAPHRPAVAHDGGEPLAVGDVRGIIVYEYDGWNTETKRWIYRANRSV